MLFTAQGINPNQQAASNLPAPTLVALAQREHPAAQINAVDGHGLHD